MTTSQTFQRPMFAWAVPVLALLLVVGGGGFVVWYWYGPVDEPTVKLSPEMSASLLNNAPDNRASFGPLQIPGKGSIIQFSAGQDWNVTAGPYLMYIQRPNGGTDFEFHFKVGRSAAFSADDLALTTLAVQLMYNPMIQRQSKAPRSLIAQLRDKFGAGLLQPELQIPDADTKSLQDAWNGYLMSTDDASRQTAGEKVLDELNAAGTKALGDNHQAFAGVIASLRELIPPDTEAKFRQNIENGTVRPLSAP